MADNHTREQRSANMKAVRSKDTVPERLIRSMLHRLGYRFRLHCKDLPGTPDIVFPARKSIVFVHGCFWHGHRCRRGELPATNIDFWRRKIATNRGRDSAAKKELQRTGWNVLTVWECETRDRAKLLKKLTRFLDKIAGIALNRQFR